MVLLLVVLVVFLLVALMLLVPVNRFDIVNMTIVNDQFWGK